MDKHELEERLLGAIGSTIKQEQNTALRKIYRILKLRLSGYTLQEISKKLKISTSTIARTIKNFKKSYPNKNKHIQEKRLVINNRYKKK